MGNYTQQPGIIDKSQGISLFQRFLRQFTLDAGHVILWSQPSTDTIVPGMHAHHNWELRLILRGTLAWPDGPASTHPPCLLIPPGRPHLSLVVDTKPSRSPPVILVLDGEGSWVFIGTRPPFSRGHGGEGLQQRLACAPNDILNALAREPDLWTDDPLRSHWEARLRSLLEAFWLAMTRAAPEHGAAVRDSLTRARDYIRTEYTRPTLTVAEVAGAAGCTPTHLAHLFRARLNTSVRQVIITRRLERAQELLAEGRYQVKEAAYLTGWRSPFHFSNAFMKHFARRPSTAIGPA